MAGPEDDEEALALARDIVRRGGWRLKIAEIAAWVSVGLIVLLIAGLSGVIGYGLCCGKVPSWTATASQLVVGLAVALLAFGSLLTGLASEAFAVVRFYDEKAEDE